MAHLSWMFEVWLLDKGKITYSPSQTIQKRIELGRNYVFGIIQSILNMRVCYKESLSNIQLITLFQLSSAKITLNLKRVLL